MALKNEKTVIILGAGASVDAGGPLMSNFFDVAEKIYRSKGARSFSGHFDKVFTSRSKLVRVLSKSELNIHNLEEVFTAFEMGQVIQRLPDMSDAKEIDDLGKSLKFVIAKTLEESVRIPVSESRMRPPSPYGNFTEFLKKSVENGNEPSVITFNYDLALDFAMHWSGVAYNYGLNGTHVPNQIDYLKLHGSLNWVPSEVDNEVHVWHLSNFLRSFNWIINKNDSISLPYLENYSKMPNAEKAILEPFIVPPTWNKGSHHKTLTKVWKVAADNLREAENIIVAGYSLPSTDPFFRLLFGLGTLGDTVVKRFWVFDPDENVDIRFRGMLGRGVLQRYRFFNTTFEDAVYDLQERLL